MSPTEFELRAALHDGEGDGDGLDTDGVIARAETYRRQRRARLLGGASVVAVVGAIGVTGGIVLTSNGNDGGGGSAQSNAGIAAPSARDAVGGGANLSYNAPRHSTDFAPMSAACTSTPSSIVIPSPGTSRPAALLFATDAVTLRICSYGFVAKTMSLHKVINPAGGTVTGNTAKRIIASLNAAPKALPQVCPQYQTLNTRRYVLTPVDAKGREGTPVELTLADNPCQTVATNGTATRYGWIPPADIARLLRELLPKATASPGSTPSGKSIPQPPGTS